MSHLTQSMVEQFFELEKESARGVLRKEMDSAMDTIFKQMKRKLMQLVDNVELGNETLNEQGDLCNRVHHDIGQMKRKLMMLMESGTRENDTDHGLAHLGDPTDREQQLHSSSNQIPSTSTNYRILDNLNSNQDDEIIVKNELGEYVNMIPNEPIPSSSTQPSNDNILDLWLNEEDCDCSKCSGDLFVKMEEGVDYNVQLVEDFNETDDSNPKPTKRCRLETDQSFGQYQPEPNKQSTPNRYITISLKCPQCSEMYIDRNALNLHLKTVHSILKHRCLYQDCTRSFPKLDELYQHHRATHPAQPNTTWPCGHCSGHFQSSRSLLTHHSMHHEEGLFRCSFRDCQFVDKLKQTVHNHFLISHKLVTTKSSTKVFVCQFPGCERKYRDSTNLKIHERSHLNVRPYRCKLPDCTYDSATKACAIRHIRTHLKQVRKQNKRFKNMSDDPNDYLEVVHELL